MNLEDFADVDHITTVAEAIGHIYKGKTIQVYWGESGGHTKYSDYDLNSNMYVEGKVLWGRGAVFALECEFETHEKKYKKQIVFNAWNVVFAGEKGELQITKIMLGAK